jgi:hypothetical protein
MHGLVNRALEYYLRDTFGAEAWHAVVRRAGLSFDSFEPLLIYPPTATEAVIATAVEVLDRPRDALLEDMGTHLVSSASGERLRRLLRFGGVNYRDFLYSLEELPDRAALALPDLALPRMRLFDLGDGEFTLTTEVIFAGAGYVLIGLLRTMADDYGALVLLDMAGSSGRGEVIAIRLLDEAYSEGRRFELAAALP